MSYSIRFSPETMRFGRDMRHRVSALNVTFRKISSGLRITSAADDASGLGIAERLEAQIKETQHEIRGGTDQVSMLQTLDSSLALAQERLLQMREIANKAANDSHSFIDRQALTDEFVSLMQELDEIADNTKFNGKPLLDSHEPLTLSLDYDSPPEQVLTRTSLRADHLGRQTSHTSLRRGVFLDPLKSGELIINDVSIRGTSDYDDQLSYCYSGGSAISKAKAINHSTQFTGVEAWVEDNVVIGVEPLRELDFNTEHWLKVNGWAVSGFKLEAKDATGKLVQHINWGYAESGVKATVGAEGQLILFAEDGRNITVEYSDDQVRDAIRIIDIYGDEVNLANSIDSPEYEHNGDIIGVEVDTAGISAVIQGDNGSGIHKGPSDYADYYLEIIEPGKINEATYRIKREELSNYTTDLADEADGENGLFNDRGVLSSSKPNRVTQASGSYYNSASNRQFVIEVVQAGEPLISGKGPTVNIFEVNLDIDPNVKTPIAGLQNIQVHSGDILDVGYGALIEIDGIINRTVNGVSVNSTNLSGKNIYGVLTNDPPGHDYPHHPEILSWNGANSTDYEFEIISGGQGHGSYSYGTEDEPYPLLKVTAANQTTGVVKSNVLTPITLDVNGAIYSFEGLSFRFKQADSKGQIIQNTSDYPTPSTWYRMTNEKDRIYELVAKENSVVTSYDSLNVTVNVYDADDKNPNNGLGTLIQTYDETMVYHTWTHLGQGTEKDNAIINFNHQSVYFAEEKALVSSDGMVDFSNVSYATPQDKIAIFEITASGDVNGSARYRYYYDDNPGVTIDSGVVKTSETMNDGIKYNASLLGNASTATLSQKTGSSTGFDLTSTNYSGEKRATYTISISDDNSQTASLSHKSGPVTDFTLTSTNYTGYLDGTIELEVKEDTPGVYSLDVKLKFSNGSESNSNIALTVGQELDLGHGLKVRFNDPSTLSNGTVLSGTFTAKNRFANYAWHYEGEASPQPTESKKITIGQSLDLGNNVAVRFNAPSGPNQVVNTGMTFSGTADPKNFDMGDKWRIDIKAGAFSVGDRVVLYHPAVDLEAGARWTVEAINEAEWLTTDPPIIVTASNNYDTTEQTLTNTITYPGGLMGDVKISGASEFQTGDQIRIKTRGYIGEVKSKGEYTKSHYPTDYIFTVTKGGAIGEAEIAWKRKDVFVDGVSVPDLQFGGQGTLSGLSAEDFVYVEHGLEIAIGDVLNSAGDSIAYLAEGDVFVVEVGKKLTYSFSGQLTLKSEENIEIDYEIGDTTGLSDNEITELISNIDNKLGRINFTGTEAQANQAGDKELSLTDATHGKSLNHSLGTTNLLSRGAIRDAIHTIDLSLKQLSEDRTVVGAAMNRVEHKNLALTQKSLDLLGIHMRLTGADMAQETAKYAAEQLKMAMTPFLLENTKVRSLVALDLVDRRQGGRF